MQTAWNYPIHIITRRTLLILEALRDFIVSTVDFKIVSEDFLFHVEKHYFEESRDLMY